MSVRHACLTVSWLCTELGVSRSGYYSWESRLSRPADPAKLKERDLVSTAFSFMGREKGARQIKMCLLNEFGTLMGLKKIRRIMRENGLVCRIREANPIKKMARAIKTHSVFSNKLNRQFKDSRPGHHLLTDISYIYYGNGSRCYLSAIKDASTNEILSWAVSESLDVGFVLDTVRGLATKGWMPYDFIIHSDQGCHYTSIAYRELLAEIGASQSMSRRGNCWDNAPMESFFGHAKDELRLSECLTFRHVVDEIDDYMDYYNNHRGQWGLKGMTPADYREWLLSRPTTMPALYVGENYLVGLAQPGN